MTLQTLTSERVYIRDYESRLENPLIENIRKQMIEVVKTEEKKVCGNKLWRFGERK